MSFTRAHRRISGEEPRRRDRHGIVGLSGWLFADLLLGIAIVFLVIQDEPGAGVLVPDRGDRENPSVTIEVEDDSLETDSVSGVAYWSDAAGRPLEVRVKFDEDVFIGASSGLELERIIEVGGDAAGLRPWELTPRDGSSGVSDEFVLTIVQAGPVSAGSLTVRVASGAARDTNGNESNESNLLSVEVRTKSVSIDPTRPVQVQISLPSRICKPNVADDVTTQRISNSRNFTVGRKGTDPDRENQKANPDGKTLSDWVAANFDPAPFGFAILTGGGPVGRDNAYDFRFCIEEAFKSLGWIGGQTFVARYYSESGLSSKLLKIDIYFLSGPRASNLP